MISPDPQSAAASHPVTLLFIRHAATDLAGTFCGASDPALNELGCAQLPPLVGRLQAQSLDAVYSSPLMRAMETAEAIARPRGLAVIARPALRELAFGDWEGLTWAQIEQRDARYAARWVAEFPALPAPNGEPFDRFMERVRNELIYLRRVAQGEIAIVTHAGMLRVLLEDYGHLSPHHAWERTREYTTCIRCTQKNAHGTLDVHP